MTAAPVGVAGGVPSGYWRGRSHRLLAASLDPADLHTVIGTSGFDTQGHGTAMAGLALYGPLDDLLAARATYSLHHRLESVRVLPNSGEPDTDPRGDGTVTVNAVARTEATTRRRRVFCMPISTDPDRPGVPTLWSSTVDALAVGTNIVRDGEQLQLLARPILRPADLSSVRPLETSRCIHHRPPDRVGHLGGRRPCAGVERSDRQRPHRSHQHPRSIPTSPVGQPWQARASSRPTAGRLCCSGNARGPSSRTSASKGAMSSPTGQLVVP